MLSWLRKTLSRTPRQPKRTLREKGIRNNVFFRLDSGPLCDAELPTKNEDVPRGAPILQHLCYELPFPWSAHAITISIWHTSLTAIVAQKQNSLYNLHFTDWDDGWLLSVDPPEAAEETEITEIITAIDAMVTRLGHVRDVRWFHDNVLTCGLFHENDFEHGTVVPFELNTSSK